MHIYKRQARNLAWYDIEGDQSKHNPFKKFRARPQRSNSFQLERQLPSQTDRPPLAEPQPRGTTSEDIRHVQSEPLPSTSSGTDHVSRPDTAEDRVAAEPAGSLEPINVSTANGSGNGDEESHPRKRKSLLGKFGGREDNETLSSSRSRSDIPDRQKFTVVGQLKATIFNSWINILILAAPVGIALAYVNVNPVAVFVINFIAIIPLAAMLSYATEEIALRTGDTIGGLLNATFGNAVELIVAIIALVDNEVLIVQTSLIGSMLSNLLLVMGMCFLFGGINRMEQHFNPVVAQTAASLLALAVASLIIPTAFHVWSDAGLSGVVPLSRGTSVMLLIVYGCYLFFQLKSHVDMYNKPSPKVEKRNKNAKVDEGAASRGIAQIGMMSASMAGQNAQQTELHDPDDQPEEPNLSIWVALLTLAGSTALVALCAEYMVDSIDALTATGNVSKTFVGLILLPIVGNAAEHATAVTVACKDKMDLAIGVAVGSSMQIALLVLPLIVVIGWIIGNDEMNLYFDAFQVILLFVAVLLVNYLISDGKSHWLEGVLLEIMYLIIAVAAWFYPTHERGSESSGR